MPVFPATVNFEAGDAVPTPTLPLAFNIVSCVPAALFMYKLLSL
jgi:hypothetical protein